MNISREYNYSIDNLNELELKIAVYNAISHIIYFYEKYTKGSEDDFLYGGCAIFANMLYNIFPNKSLVYVSNDHAVTKIGDTFYDVKGIVEEEKINKGNYMPCDFKEESGRYAFYQFCDNCKISDTGRFSDILNQILDEVKVKMNYSYDEEIKLTR